MDELYGRLDFLAATRAKYDSTGTAIIAGPQQARKGGKAHA
jgi:hypothetical protein